MGHLIPPLRVCNYDACSHDKQLVSIIISRNELLVTVVTINGPRVNPVFFLSKTIKHYLSAMNSGLMHEQIGNFTL